VPLIYNNTIDGNVNGILMYSFSPVIKNNIITNGSGYGISGQFNSYPNADYNDVWTNAAGGYYFVSPGSHDKSVDPLYTSGTDFHLKTSPTLSLCIDGGTDVGLAYNGLPDMGAYESATTRPNPWPPDGLVATPRSAKVALSWNANIESNITGYKVSYGNVSGSYTNTTSVGNTTDYVVTSLVNDATYFFAVKATNSLSNDSDYSAEVSATPTAGAHELPHYAWDASYGGCTACHFKDTGSGELLPPGFDYRYSSELCYTCHNTTGQGRGKLVDTANSHTMFVNATTGGNNLPTYGNITGRYSNRMGDRLDAGKLVCNTCHNTMEKSEDPGRTWRTPRLRERTRTRRTRSRGRLVVVRLHGPGDVRLGRAPDRTDLRQDEGGDEDNREPARGL